MQGQQSLSRGICFSLVYCSFFIRFGIVVIMKKIGPYLAIILLSLPPLIYIFLNPNLPHTSDGLMHVARSAAYFNEIQAGQFPIRWAHQFDYGYGTPIFNFFNPLPYAFGALLLSIGINLATTLKIGFVVTQLLSGIFILLFARTFFKNSKTAFLVAVMYQYVPFRLVEMHTRGDIGCLYSYMTFPLLMYAITVFLKKNTIPGFLLLGLASALLPLGHNINGFVFFCLGSLYVLFATKDVKKILVTFLAMGFGLLSISYFLLPALTELKYLNGYIFSKHLFYMHFPAIYKLLLPNITNNPSLRVAEVSVQVGLFNVASLIGFIYLFAKKRIAKENWKMSSYLLVVGLLTFVIMLPITKPLWEHIEYLRQFQFPWRFLGILIFVTPMAGGIVFEKLDFIKKSNIKYYILLALIILSTVFYWGPYQGFQKIDENYYRNFPGSTNYFAEVNTIWMEQEPQEYPKKRVEIAAGNAQISNITLLPERHTYTVLSKEESTVIDKTYFYPGWKAYVNGIDTPIEFQDANYRGQITFKVPTGNNNVVVTFEQNKIMKTGNIITLTSIASIILMLGYYFFKKYGKRKK